MSKYSQKGPFAVGVQEIVVAGEGGRDLPVWVWYPTVRPSNQRAGHLFGSHVPYDAHENATPVEEVLPLVLFSHGNGGLAQQSTFVTTHLASWGFAVAAPDHVGNTIAETFEVTEKDALRAMHREAIHNRPEDLRAVLDVLAGTKKQKDSQDAVVPLPKVAVPALGFLGHSFGGWTSLKAASILPVKSAVALAPADEWFVGKKACVGMYPPKVPVLTIAAKLDVLVDFDKHILPLAHKLGPEKSRLVVMPRADHMYNPSKLFIVKYNTNVPTGTFATTSQLCTRHCWAEPTPGLHPWTTERSCHKSSRIASSTPSPRPSSSQYTSRTRTFLKRSPHRPSPRSQARMPIFTPSRPANCSSCV